MQDRVDEESQKAQSREYIDNDPFMYVPKRDTPVLNRDNRWYDGKVCCHGR
jgi:hypothetical protein